MTKTIEAQLSRWLQEWDQKLCSNSRHFCPLSIKRPIEYDTLSEEYASNYYTYWNSIGHFYYNYATLVVNSFGLQNALDRSQVDIAHFFIQCHSSAVACATIVRDELGPGGFLRYSPDSHFVQCSYAVLSLLKVTPSTSQMSPACNISFPAVYEACLPRISE